MAGKIKAAILVDADNLPIKQVEEALKKLAEICNPVIKKAFGDFTGSAKSWTPEFMRWHGFTPVLHFPVTRFKNGADIAMCIAAMDIVHAKSVDAIVIFTSDSDFAALAARIRESGMEVVGVGDAKSNTVLQGAFDRFVVVEPPKSAAVKHNPPSAPEAKPAKVIQKPAVPKKTTPKVNPQISSKLRSVILRAVLDLTINGEPAMLAQVNVRIKEKIPDFDYKKCQFSSLSKMMKSMNELELVNTNRKVRLK